MLAYVSSPTADRVVGQVWEIVVDGAGTPAVVVTLPDGTALDPVLTFGSVLGYYGRHSVTVPLTTPGRYLATVTHADGAASGVLHLQCFAAAVTANAGLPDAAELSDWMGGADAHSYEDADLEQALAAESAAQRRVCRIPVAYPIDLREALLRRAARNLYMRRQLTELPGSDGDIDLAPIVPPGRDQEIRRLEAPWRKLVVG